MGLARLEYSTCVIDGDRKIKVSAFSPEPDCDSDHLTFVVEKRSTRTSMAYRGGDLEEPVSVHRAISVMISSDRVLSKRPSGLLNE